jgi:hypothetical protein
MYVPWEILFVLGSALFFAGLMTGFVMASGL